MFALILAAMLPFSNYPLNPTAEDTLNSMNLHVTAGVSGQSGMISAGPEFTLKYEYLFNHPFVFRTSFEYLTGEIDAVNYPNGDVTRTAVSTEVLYYKGTQKLTAVVGIGAVLGMGSFELKEADFFDQRENGVPRDISLSDTFGYRFLLGLRLHHRYSIEIVVTDISPSFIYYDQTGTTSFSEEKINFKANYIKLSLGYLFHLK